MALDEPRHSDRSIETAGVRFLVAEEDAAWILGNSGVRVDRIETGHGGFFHVSPRHSPGGGCG
jgi:hypothetical protein